MTPALSAERERRMVWVLAGIQFMHILDFVLMMPLGPQLMRLFALTPRDFGILVSVYMFAAAVSGVAASAFADRFDRRTLLLALLLGFVAALVATAAAPSFGALIYVSNRGLRHGPPEVLAQLARGEDVDPARYYMRTQPWFETGDARYAWLNRTICVGSGVRRPDAVEIEFYEVL